MDPHSAWSVNSVAGLDAFIPYYPRSLKDANLAACLGLPGFSFHELDLRCHDLAPACEGVQVVFHLAAMPGLMRSWDDFDLYQSCNLAATHRLLEAARHMPLLHRFVYGSTSSVYAQQSKVKKFSEMRTVGSPSD